MLNTSKEVLPFDYGGNQIQVVIHDSNPHFVLTDVCKVLGIQNAPRTVESLDDDEYLLYVLRRAGQNREVQIITESGLYHLIFKSRKKAAQQFRRWVTSEVLPQIRTTGSYTVATKEVGRKTITNEAGQQLRTVDELKKDFFVRSKRSVTERQPYGSKWMRARMQGIDEPIMMLEEDNGDRWIFFNKWLTARGVYKSEVDTYAYLDELHDSEWMRLQPDGKGHTSVFVREAALSRWNYPIVNIGNNPAPAPRPDLLNRIDFIIQVEQHDVRKQLFDLWRNDVVTDCKKEGGASC